MQINKYFLQVNILFNLINSFSYILPSERFLFIYEDIYNKFFKLKYVTNN